jgi:hypothetical protein
MESPAYAIATKICYSHPLVLTGWWIVSVPVTPVVIGQMQGVFASFGLYGSYRSGFQLAAMWLFAYFLFYAASCLQPFFAVPRPYPECVPEPLSAVYSYGMPCADLVYIVALITAALCYGTTLSPRSFRDHALPCLGRVLLFVAAVVGYCSIYVAMYMATPWQAAVSSLFAFAPTMVFSKLVYDVENSEFFRRELASPQHVLRRIRAILHNGDDKSTDESRRRTKNGHAYSSSADGVMYAA